VYIDTRAFTFMYTLSLSLMRLVSVLSFSIILVPWYLSVAPATMLLAVMSDWQARKVNKMSVKGTWKILGGTVVLPIMHCWCTACFWATFGEFGGLVWFFIAPMGGMLAIFAAEEAALLIKSLKGLMCVYICIYAHTHAHTHAQTHTHHPCG